MSGNCSALTSVSCVNNNPSATNASEYGTVTLPQTPGTYYIRVYDARATWGNGNGNFTICVTGVIPTPDGKSLLINSQHSSAENAFPYNHSFTFAIHGFDKLKVTALQEPTIEKIGFKVYPNPTTRMVYFNKTTDIAIYNVEGKRMRVERNTNQVDVSDLVTGIYFVQTAEGDVAKLMVQE
jgi:hypothetical protein